jgi:hypothetical protein
LRGFAWVLFHTFTFGKTPYFRNSPVRKEPNSSDPSPIGDGSLFARFWLRLGANGWT